MKLNRIVYFAFVCVPCFLGIISVSANDSLESGFTQPPASAKARTWWHWINGNVSREGITADLEAMKRVGIQEAQLFTVDQGYPEGPAKFLGDEWLDLFRFAVLEAERLGLEIGFHNGSGWSSSGGPWVTPEYAMQTVVFSEIHCKGDTRIQQNLPQPPTRLNYYKDIAVLAFPTPSDKTRIDRRELKTLSGHGFPDRLYPDQKSIPASALVRKADIINLTQKMSPEGTLDWNAPSGEWTILRIGHTPTGTENRPAVIEGRGLECDKLSRAAVDVYWAGGIEPILKKLGPLVGPVVTNCLIDSYEVGCNNWTSGFDKDFLLRRGYDCISFLPTLAGYYVESGEISERFLWDFRKTIGDMMADNYYAYFSELCHRHGMKFSVEPYGGPFDGLNAGDSGDIPMTEFWVGENVFPDASKLAASIAHLNGTPFVGAEAFTASGQYSRWLNQPATLKPIGDKMWADGVNRFIFHTYAHQPWDVAPGMTFHMYGTEISRLNTWWEQGRAYMDYLARSQFLLQQGRFVADVLVFVGESSPNAGIYRPDIKALGYDYDEIGTNKIESLTVENGWIRTPSGGSYRVLVLPDIDWMSPDVMQKIGKLVKAGATIIGPKPLKSPSLRDFPKCDDEVTRLANEIWGRENGLKSERNTVVQNQSVETVLKDMGLAPDFSGGASGSDLLFIHRTVGDADIYFIANPQKQNRNETCQFRVSGKQPEFWNPQTGEIRNAVVWNSDKTHTTVPIHFDSEDSVFVVFRKTLSPSADHIVEAETKLIPAKVRPLPDLRIVQAEYGTFLPAGLADVTAALAARITPDGTLRTTADNGLAPSDPAPGTIKELRVEYEINGQVRKLHVLESQPLTISEANGFRLIKAIYGKFPQGFDDMPSDLPIFDVTAKVNAMIASEVFIFPADDRLIDKSSSEMSAGRELRLIYSVEGEIQRMTVAYGREVDLTLGIPESKLIFEQGKATWVTPQSGSIAYTTALGINKTVEVKSVPIPLEIIGAWDVSFPPKLGAPPKARFEKLASWTTNSDEGIRYFSGTASYRKRIIVPEHLVQEGRSLELDLGRVRVIAEVILNGKNLGILWKAPFRINLGDSVRSSENDLEVRITNLWPNRLIGDARFPEDTEWGDWLPKRWPDWLINKTERSSERITFTTWRHWNADSPLQVSGLLGPVFLRPYVHVKLSE